MKVLNSILKPQPLISNKAVGMICSTAIAVTGIVAFTVADCISMKHKKDIIFESGMLHEGSDSLDKAKEVYGN